jgi:hypothetical protein
VIFLKPLVVAEANDGSCVADVIGMMIHDVTNYVVFRSSLKHAVDLKRQILLLIYSKKRISLPNPFESAEHSLKEGVFLPCKCCRIASKAVLFCKAM